MKPNGHAVPLPVKPIPLSPAELEAKGIVMGMIRKVGYEGVGRMIEMSLPRFCAVVGLSEGTLPHDEKLVALLGALERGTANVAQFLHERKPNKVVAPNDGVKA